MYSDMRSAHGASENLSSGPSFGRPRCEHAATFAPASSRYLRVGTDARMRVSSVMVLPSSGTLRSQRTRTFLPLSSAGERSATDFFAIIDTAWRAGGHPRRLASRGERRGARDKSEDESNSTHDL